MDDGFTAYLTLIYLHIRQTIPQEITELSILRRLSFRETRALKPVQRILTLSPGLFLLFLLFLMDLAENLYVRLWAPPIGRISSNADFSSLSENTAQLVVKELERSLKCANLDLKRRRKIDDANIRELFGRACFDLIQAAHTIQPHSIVIPESVEVVIKALTVDDKHDPLYVARFHRKVLGIGGPGFALCAALVLTFQRLRQLTHKGRRWLEDWVVANGGTFKKPHLNRIALELGFPSYLSGKRSITWRPENSGMT